MGGAGELFPTTIWSSIRTAGEPSGPESQRELSRVIRAYWKPVYAYIRASWRKSVEDAKDLTQAFFLHLLERGFLARSDPERGSFRAYLKQALKYFLIDAERAAAVRRPDRPAFSLEASPAELERIGPASPDELPERAYDRQWFRCLMDSAVEALREALTRQGKSVYFQVFRAYFDLDPEDLSRSSVGAAPSLPTYSEVARRLDIRETDVRNYLTYCRSALRLILRERIGQYVESEGDVDMEIQALLNG